MAGIILIVIVVQFAVIAGGGYYFVSSRKKATAIAERAIAAQLKQEKDCELGERLFGEIGIALSTHSDSLQQVQDAKRGDKSLASLQNSSRETTETLTVCGEELNELMEQYGDIYRTERTRVEQYSDNAAKLEQLIESCVIDTPDDRSEMWLELVRDMVNENAQLKTKVASCRQQMSELVAKSTIAERDARIDTSTNLPNRRAWEEELGRLAFEQSWAMVIVDVDSFKNINDGYGHDAGDAMLMTVATVLRNARDVKAFRIAGDEFTFLVKDTTLEASMKITERIRNSVSQASLRYKGDVLRVTTSLGLALRRQEESPHETFIRADQALYLAKTSGGNQVQMLKSKPKPVSPK